MSNLDGILDLTKQHALRWTISNCLTSLVSMRRLGLRSKLIDIETRVLIATIMNRLIDIPILNEATDEINTLHSQENSQT